MAFENSAGLGVTNQYGPRDTGGTVGVERTSDSVQNLSIAFTAASLIGGGPQAFKVLRGTRFTRYILRVDEAFTLTGTTPTVIFGGAVPTTNGVVLTAAELAAVGTKAPASAGTGTWSTSSATGVAANETVKQVLGGTTPAVTPGAGKATLTAEFYFKTKV